MKTLILVSSLLITTLRLNAAPPENFAVHEWGTFTSVQGADGAQMYWNPKVAVELPRFVYPWLGNLNALLLGKASFICKQRMETPVIYFYSQREQDVDVAVDFRSGAITEWYPFSAPEERRKAFAAERSSANPPALLWEKLHLTPPSQSADGLRNRLPVDQSGSHYFAARETDSDFVQTRSEHGTPEIEKFLFYRGVAFFDAPLTVKLDGKKAEVVSVENHRTEALSDLYVIENDADFRGWAVVAHLEPGECRTIPRADLTPASADELANAVAPKFRDALVRQGLYQREADAMIATWRTTWFNEPGLRVFYPFPRRYTDANLPLQINPAPTDLVRVMVGRAEVITPQSESRLADAVTRYLGAGTNQAAHAKIAAEVRRYGFGRFANSIMERITKQSKRSSAFDLASANLLLEASAPAPGS